MLIPTIVMGVIAAVALVEKLTRLLRAPFPIVLQSATRALL